MYEYLQIAAVICHGVHRCISSRSCSPCFFFAYLWNKVNTKTKKKNFSQTLFHTVWFSHIYAYNAYQKKKEDREKKKQRQT